MRFAMNGEANKGQEQNSDMQALNMPHVTSDAMAAHHRYVANRKRVITAVVALAMCVTVVSGILGGIYLFTEQNKATLQYTLKLLDHNKFMGNEEVLSDVTDNTVQYHVTRNDSQWWILNDFSKGLKVTKVQEGRGQFKCLVSVLKTEDAVKPSDISQPSDLVNRNEDNAVGDVEVTRVARQAVLDRSFLGSAARRLCSDAPVHWTYTESLGDLTDATSSSSYSPSSGRSKRQADKCFWCLCGYKFCFPEGSCSEVKAVFQVIGGKITCNLHIGGDNCPPAKNVVSIDNCPR